MFLIRRYQPSDARDMTSVFTDAVSRLARADYSPEQVSAWLRNRPDETETLARCADGRETFVAVNDAGRVVAFIDLEPDGHIDLFYARPEVKGSGVARGLYAELEESALAQGMAVLTVEASEAARRFFEAQGFSTIMRREFDIHGVTIHNYRMQKRLRPNA